MLGPSMEDLESFQLSSKSQDTREQRTRSLSKSLTPTSMMRQISKEAGGLVNVLMIGTGEYTTGFVNNAPSDSDKSAGVVALTMFDLRARGKLGRIGLCGVNGGKFPAIREHFQRVIGDVYEGLNLEVETFPDDSASDPLAYRDAINHFNSGDIAIIFTPDDTHYEIALYALSHGLHVLLTKPAVKTLEHHRHLVQTAQKYNVVLAVEVHKRWDPMYSDARDRIVSQLGDFSYFYSFMSQPKHQLQTFKAWAGKKASSDISYYLNSHHVDFHEWCVGERSRPVSVCATSSEGLASSLFEMDTEDTITLTVQWENRRTDGVRSTGTAVYTASWIASKSDVHSQQRCFYMGQKGEITIDQAHRGYSFSSDDSAGLRSLNPLFMKYVPRQGRFAGQLGYGYRSLESFVDCVSEIRRGEAAVSDAALSLALLEQTLRTTAILEAGRLSLDNQRAVKILYEDKDGWSVEPIGLAVV